jgi:hypothetical protein
LLITAALCIFVIDALVITRVHDGSGLLVGLLARLRLAFLGCRIWRRFCLRGESSEKKKSHNKVRHRRFMSNNQMMRKYLEQMTPEIIYRIMNHATCDQEKKLSNLWNSILGEKFNCMFMVYIYICQYPW